MDQFGDHLIAFEESVARCVRDGFFGQKERITTKPNALKDLPFGKVMGNAIPSNMAFTIDYYGYLKRSTGQEFLICKALAENPPQRFIESIVVHFASIRIEDVVRLMPLLKVAVFVEFKSIILDARGFKRK